MSDCRGEAVAFALDSSQAVAQLLERRPARVDVPLGVLVGLGVQILATDGAEAGTVRATEDLLGNGEG